MNERSNWRAAGLDGGCADLARRRVGRQPERFRGRDNVALGGTDWGGGAPLHLELRVTFEMTD